MFNKGKGKGVPVHAVSAYTGSGDVAPFTQQFTAERHVYPTTQCEAQNANDRYSQQPIMAFITQPHVNSGVLHITLGI